MHQANNKILLLGLIGLYLITITSALDAASAVNKPTSSSNNNKVSSTQSKNSLITINEDDWEQLLQGEWMVEFHAPWCPACRALQKEWKTFSSWGTDLGIKVGACDVTVNPGLSGRFMVTALPTIYHVKDGIFRQYKGTRDTNSFVSFIEEKKWQTVEPVSSWKAPNSIQMSIVSNFFKISMALRAIHNNLVEDYGIPYWGSYILFAFATILFGAILGLMIVCIIDLIFPAKNTPDEVLKRPSTQGDLIDDTEDNLHKNSDKRGNVTISDKDEETEVEIVSDEEYDEEMDGDNYPDEEDEYDSEDAPQIEEVIDNEPEEEPKRTVRQRKARRD